MNNFSCNLFVWVDQTTKLVIDIRDLKITGAPGAFDKEFKEMEAKLEEVKRLVSGINVTGDDFTVIQRQITEIRYVNPSLLDC